jgi:hypothetical protein
MARAVLRATGTNRHRSGGTTKEISMGKKSADTNTPKKKLDLKRETLAVLDPEKLSQVVGGQFRCCGHGPITSA